MFLKEVAVELHDTLNSKLWDENNNLRPLVKDRLIKIVDKYIESSDAITKDDVIDVELLGSNASYNYTPYSDLDIHLVVNMEDVSCDPALFQLACNAERSNFNKNYDFKIKGIDVELYVEDVHAGTASNGIYSLFNDEWIKFPQKITVPDYDNDEEYIKLLDSWKSLAETTLANAMSASQVQDYINNLYNLRRTSIMKDGEFGKGNLVFKEIRNEGLLDELKQKQYELSSKELSLESLKESDVTLYRGIDRALQQFDKNVEWWTPDYDDAYNYGPGGSDDPEQAHVLKTTVNFDNYKTLFIKGNNIEDIYLDPKVLDTCNILLTQISKENYVFKDKSTSKEYVINKNLQELQRFINNRLKNAGYDFFVTQFNLNGKQKTEVAVLTSGILKFEHPDWYTEKLFDKSNSLCYNLIEEYNNRMFVELPLFSQNWEAIGLTDEQLRLFQNDLLNNPQQGDVIPKSGGARKTRLNLGTGKSHGARIIYVDYINAEKLYLLDVYTKSYQKNLTQNQLNNVKTLIKELDKEE